MANEIAIQFSLVVRNGGFTFSFTPDQMLVTQVNPGRHGNCQHIGDEPAEVIDFGDAITEGWLVLKNNDATNYIRWGPARNPGTGQHMVPCGLIAPGKIAVFEVYPGTVLMADTYVADTTGPTATALLEVNLLER